MRKPKYRKHRDNVGFVELQRKRYYFPGKYNSVESFKAYNAFVLKHVIEGEPLPGKTSQKTAKSTFPQNDGVKPLAEVAIMFLEHAKKVHGDKAGGEFRYYRRVLNEVVDMFGGIDINEFRSAKLSKVKEKMISRGLAVNTVRGNIGAIKRFMRWAMIQELVTPETYVTIDAVGVDANRKDIKKTKTVTGVSREVVDATLPFVGSPIMRTLIDFLWWTGARAGNAGKLRPCEIDTSGEVWQWAPGKHKNSWRNQELVIAIGPRAQKTLTEIPVTLKDGTETVLNLLDRDDDAYCFSPRESERIRLGNNLAYRQLNEYYASYAVSGAIVHALRKQAGLKSRQKGDPKPTQADIEAAGVTYWHAHQLRHARCEITRNAFGIEASAAIAGHKSLKTNLIYAPKNERLRDQAALELG